MNITRYLYAYKALDDFVLIYPFYALYFASDGMSPFAISTLFIIWVVVSLVAEIPTGVLADRYPRRNILMLGSTLKATGFAMWLLFPDYAGFAAGFMLWGIGESFDSGTFQALVFDELKRTGKEKSYAKVIGRAKSFGLGAVLAATALASIVFTFGYDALLYSSIAAVLGAGFVIFLMPEAPRARLIGEEAYVASLKNGVKEAVRNPVLRRVVLLGGIMAAVYGSLEEYIPLLFKDFGITDQVIPLLIALTEVAAIIASVAAYRYEKVREKIFLSILGIVGLLLVIAGTIKGIPGVALIISYTLLIVGLETLYDAKLQHTIASDLRATITSVSEFFAGLAGIVIFLIFGILGNFLGYSGAFVVSGLAVISISLSFVLSKRKVFKDDVR